MCWQAGCEKHPDERAVVGRRVDSMEYGTYRMRACQGVGGSGPSDESPTGFLNGGSELGDVLILKTDVCPKSEELDLLMLGVI